MYKGLNRAIATASAGVIALGVHWIASKSDEKFQPFIRSGSVFVLGTYQQSMSINCEVFGCTYEYDNTLQN